MRKSRFFFFFSRKSRHLVENRCTVLFVRNCRSVEADKGKEWKGRTNKNRSRTGQSTERCVRSFGRESAIDWSISYNCRTERRRRRRRNSWKEQPYTRRGRVLRRSTSFESWETKRGECSSKSCNCRTGTRRRRNSGKEERDGRRGQVLRGSTLCESWKTKRCDGRGRGSGTSTNNGCHKCDARSFCIRQSTSQC